MAVNKTNANSPTQPVTADPTTTPKTDAGAATAEWTALSTTYADLQKTAYTTQGVKTTEVTDLRDKLEAYVKANVTDTAQQKTMLSAIDTDLTAMATATDAKEKTGKTSNDEWDTARTDLEDLLTELAPEGADAVWTPTTAAAQGKNLAAVPSGAASETDTGTDDKTTKDPAGTTASSGASAAAGSVSGIPMISLDAMVSKFPQLAPYKDLFNSMGQKYNVPPQMLAAHAMQESHANPSEGNGGMMQFQNQQTWEAYGDKSIPISSFNASNVSAQVEGAAKYDAYLMSKHGGDLNGALLEYSGGLPDYPAGIKKWLSGVDGYSG